MLLAGEPGTGKTTFAMQFLFHGAARGERGLYVTAVSEPQWVVQKFLSTYNFFNADAIERGDIAFADISDRLSQGPEGALTALTNLVEAQGPRRIVLDPITPFTANIGDDLRAREFMHKLFATFKAWNAVSIVTAEMSYASIPQSLEGYMADSVVVLSYPEEEKVRRKYIEVLKMRGTRHMTGRQLLDISEGGIGVQVGLR
jgi:circadian clock protein KaiC